MRSYMAGVGVTAGQRDVAKGFIGFCELDRGRFPGSDLGDRAVALGRGRVRKCLTMVYAVLVIAGICAAGAEERQTVNALEPIEFHIPVQPLASALQAYGQRTGIQVLYESNSAVGRSSVAVNGNFKPDAALDLLLTGTELRVKYIRPDAITLALRSADGDAPPPIGLATADLSLGTLWVRGTSDGDDTARLHDYSESVQTDIQKALQRNARTRAGSYRAVLDLWIDPSRTIQRTELFRSTGDRERDTAVAAALRGVTISRPAPANTPQPVRVAIVVESLQ